MVLSSIQGLGDLLEVKTNEDPTPRPTDGGCHSEQWRSEDPSPMGTDRTPARHACWRRLESCFAGFDGPERLGFDMLAALRAGAGREPDRAVSTRWCGHRDHRAGAGDASPTRRMRSLLDAADRRRLAPTAVEAHRKRTPDSCRPCRPRCWRIWTCPFPRCSRRWKARAATSWNVGRRPILRCPKGPRWPQTRAP